MSALHGLQKADTIFASDLIKYSNEQEILNTSQTQSKHQSINEDQSFC